MGQFAVAKAGRRSVRHDAALEGDPDDIYGRLIGMGATLIQTDRPELLLTYLRSKGLHD